MVDQRVEVVCGPPDERKRRKVVARLGSRTHTDRLDIDQQFTRTKWRDAVVSKFGLDDDAHDFLEAEIFRAAESGEGERNLWQAGVVSLDTVETLSTEWLWDQYLPAGAITVVDGDPGLGKSQLTMDLAARLSRGNSMPPHTAPSETFPPRGTLILNAEDDPARTLKPRLDAAGANSSHVHLLREMLDSDGGDSRPVSLPRDLPAIEGIVTAKNIGLMVIDPFVAYLDSKLSANSDADVRRCLGQVSAMAERTGVSVLLIRHLNKKSGLGAMYRGGGSIGITGAARAAFMVGKDPSDSEARILAPVKNNLAPEPPSLRFTIESAGTTSRVCWGSSCDISATDLLGDAKPSRGSKLEKAKDIIGEILTDGPRGSNEVEVACRDAGISTPTYKRARKEIGVVSEKCGFGDGQWILSMPSFNGEANHAL